MFYNKEKVIDQINILENKYGTEGFQEEYNIFFASICEYLDIPDHIANNIISAPDPLIKDSVLWKFFNKFQLNMTFRDYKCFGIDKGLYKEKKKNNSLRVEPLDSFGMLNSIPSKEIVTDLSAYTFIRSKPYLLTLVKENHFAYEEDEFYSEQKWTDKETAILIATINLSIKQGWCSFFIGNGGFYVPIGLYGIDTNVLSDVSIKKMQDLIDLYEYVNEINFDGNRGKSNFYYNKDINTKDILNLNNKIDRNNSTLVRCLYYYAKACFYTSHTMMMEEATALQLFCLDGMQKLFMQKYNLKKTEEVNKLLNDKFNWPHGDYLKELYDDRTIYVHPSNRHGDYWCPPWDADTCYDTMPLVREIILIYLLEKYEKNNF